MADMTIKEAALSLGVSVDTIRRRIKSKQIEAWKIDGAYGQQWVINSDSLAEYQQVIEVIPVKYNMNPDNLIQIIKQTVQEATEETISKGIKNGMQEHYKELEELKSEVKALREIIQLKEVQRDETLIKKVKALFKKD